MLDSKGGAEGVGCGLCLKGGKLPRKSQKRENKRIGVLKKRGVAKRVWPWLRSVFLYGGKEVETGEVKEGGEKGSENGDGGGNASGRAGEPKKTCLSRVDLVKKGKRRRSGGVKDEPTGK